MNVVNPAPKRGAKKAIKKNEANWPVKKSVRVRREATAPTLNDDQESPID